MVFPMQKFLEFRLKNWLSPNRKRQNNNPTGNRSEPKTTKVNPIGTGVWSAGVISKYSTSGLE